MDHHTRSMVNASIGGSLLGKITDQGYALLEKTMKNGDQWPAKKRKNQRIEAAQDSDTLANLTTKVDNLASLMTRQAISEPLGESQYEEINYIGHQGGRNFGERIWGDRQFCGNQPPQNPNNYHLGLRNHENFLYANTRNTLQPPTNFEVNKGVIDEPSKKLLLEEMFTSFMGEMRNFMRETRWKFAQCDERLII
ncbi:hypothetical protein ACS0TY_005450 [Phlomoides rotata]